MTTEYLLSGFEPDDDVTVISLAAAVTDVFIFKFYSRVTSESGLSKWG